MVITNTDGTKPIAGFSADNATSDSIKKLVREVRKQIKDDPSLLHGEVTAVETDERYSENSENSLLIESRAWTNVQGKTITAAVVSVDDLNVVFQLANGKNTTYPLENLSDHSQALLKEMTE